MPTAEANEQKCSLPQRYSSFEAHVKKAQLV